VYSSSFLYLYVFTEKGGVAVIWRWDIFFLLVGGAPAAQAVLPTHTHNRRASGKRKTTSAGEMSSGAFRGERDMLGMNEIMQI